MLTPPTPTDEAARQRALDETELLDSPRDRVVDDLVALVARVTAWPMALVSLVDSHRQWFLSNVGVSGSETPRDLSFCAHAVADGGMLEVPDARVDPRFSNNPFVTSSPHIRAYLGAPIVTHDGHALGTLCVLHHEPRVLSANEKEMLSAIAKTLATLFDARREARKAREEILWRQMVMDATQSGQMLLDGTDPARPINQVSEAFCALTGYSKDEIIGSGLNFLFGEGTHAGTVDQLERVQRDGGTFECELVVHRKDGSPFPARLSMQSVHDDTLKAQIAVTLVDLSEQVDARRALLNSEEQYQDLWQHTPVMMHGLGSEQQIIAVSNAWLEQLGYQRHEVVGKPWVDFLTARSRDANAQTVAHPGAPLSDLQLQFVRSSGEFVVLSMSTVQRSLDQEIQQIGVLHDVTKHRHHATLARFSERVSVPSADNKCIWAEAVSAVAHALEVAYCSVLELESQDDTLIERASWGWPAEHQNQFTVAVRNKDDAYSLAGYTIRVGAPVVSEDVATDRRFATPPVLREYGIVSALSCPIQGTAAGPQLYGAFVVHSPEPRQFSALDVDFLRSIASLLGMACQRAAAQSLLLTEKERAEVTLASIGDAVIATNEHGEVEYMNAVAEALTDWSLGDARGLPLPKVFNIIDEQSRDPVPNPVERCIREDRVIGLSNHTILLTRRGRECSIQDSAAPIRAKDGAITGVVLVFSDVSEARRLALEIRHQATHDALTSLPNRREFEQRLQRTLARAKRDGSNHAICYMDLDQFKVVNDSCGHAAGDELLRQVAVLLGQRIRDRDTFARLGGDEFGVLLEFCTLHDAYRAADALLQFFDDFRFNWENKIFRVGASIGLVAIDNTSPELHVILAQADKACYAAKDEGRNRIHVFNPDDDLSASRGGELRWASRIQQDIEENRLVLFAQPIFPTLGARTLGQRCEVLVRLRDRDGTLIAPGQFLPAAERYHLASRLDRWVVEHALRFLSDHETLFDTLELFSLNLSGQSVGDVAFQTFLAELLDGLNLPNHKICFEITETTAISNLANASGFIDRIASRGCRFALDDFGSGMSSFGYLRNLPVDIVKIDGAFVRGVLSDPVNLYMVRAIHDICELTGKTTIAEYVENTAILDRLGEVGIDFVQGFELGRPRPLEELFLH